MRAYRGIPIGKKEFVYGSYCEVDQDRAFIISPQASCEQNFGGDYVITGAFEVIAETVGQSTGRHDTKWTKEYPEGQEIYQGDKIKVLKKELIGHCHGSVMCNVFIRHVTWDAQGARFVCRCVGGHTYKLLEDWPVVVIGNIHQQEQK